MSNHDDHFPDATRRPYIFPAWQSQLWVPQPELFLRPVSPANSQVITPVSQYQSASVAVEVDSSKGNNVNAATKGRSANWLDAEIQFLIAIWKDHHPISKRHNSAVWESIAKQLNTPLTEQELTSIRTASQCKAKMKNLEDEYKRVKDHNNRSGNDRETFTYYEDLNEKLGRRAKITPKTVVECGFEDNNLPSNISPSSSVRKSTSPAPGPSDELSEFSDENEEDQSLSKALFRCKPDACKRKKALARTPTSSKQQRENSAESSGDEDLTFSKSLFFKRKPRTKANKEAPGTSKQRSVKRRKNKESNGQTSG